MPDLQDLVQSVFSGGNLEAISSHLGVSTEETAAGIAATLPALFGALAGNASTQRGEEKLESVLDRDHDGSLLDSLGGMLAGSLGGKAANGAGILGHLFGDDNHQNEVTNNLAGKSGVSPALISKLLPLLAPMVMAWLGKQLRSNRGGATQAAATGQGGGLLGGVLGGVLGQMMGGGSGGGLADLLGGLLGGQSKPAPAATPSKGVDLGSILGSIFGR